MREILGRDFFAGDTLEAAESLLGKYLVRRRSGVETALLVNEVEAYDGFSDKASHASRGLTERNRVMFGGGGLFYVYFVYGIHWMLNIVTGGEGYPAAVLIRGAGEISGPARLTRYLEIDGAFNKMEAAPESGLWFEDRGVEIPKERVIMTPRIGVDYAGPVWSKKPYRMTLKNRK